MEDALARRLACFGAAASVVVGPLLGTASAETTLTVDLAAPLGSVTHAASGSLYGVTETKPADLTKLLAPLHPHVFTNPAADVQQPVGDAIVVAGRVAPVGGQVMIRLADWFPGFYTFSNMTDWFDKLGQTVTRKQASGLTNFYGYEIWNEPQGTYKGSLSFNDFWNQTYVKLRSLDSTAKIIGPSIAVFDSTFMNGFLSFCKTNGCLPDIVCWHELAGQNLTANLQNYRALEKQLGISPLPISINEYSGNGRIDDEGKPGASAPLIAKFERFRVDSACISYWDVAHAGRLGSLLATDTATNGGWWFYKWYGDMSGNMVSTTPPTPSSPTALDGFANLDATAGFASVVLGGTNDGSVKVVVKGFSAAPFFGGSVHVVVESTPFVNRSTAVTATTTVSTADYVVSADAINVPISGTNASDGYRVYLTPTGGFAGAAGAPASGGAGGASAGAAGASHGGESSLGGRGSGAGGAHDGGVAGATRGMGGAEHAGAGSAGTAGALSAPGNGGKSSGGEASGGAPTVAVAGSSGSSWTSGGLGGVGMAGAGAPPTGGGSAAPKGAADAGCGCRTSGGRRDGAPAAALLVVGAWLSSRRRLHRTRFGAARCALGAGTTRARAVAPSRKSARNRG